MADEGGAGLKGVGLGAYRQAGAERLAADLQRVQSKVAGQAAGQRSAPQVRKLTEAAEQFEALLLKQMFSSMWEALPGGGLLSSSREEEIYRDFLNEGLAENMAKTQSIGIKDVILRDLQRLDGKKG